MAKNNKELLKAFNVKSQINPSTKDYNAFKDAVLKASISVLKRYGIMGYSLAWNMPYNAFPIHKFLALLGIKAERQSCNDECKSNVFEELEILMNVLNQA